MAILSGDNSDIILKKKNSYKAKKAVSPICSFFAQAKMMCLL